jgi:molecular chaperone DnaJ
MRDVQRGAFLVSSRGATMAEKRDYYEILEVQRDATDKDLKNSFRRLARKYHPDRSTEQDAESKFKEIQEAYAVLSDPQKRAQYDRFGHSGPSGNPFSGFEGGFNINLEDLFGGDLFSSIFGGGRRRSRQRRGSDILVRHSVDFADVYYGSKEEITLDLPLPCGSCDGTGAKDGALDTCDTCRGQGQIQVREQIGPFVQSSVRTCSDCGGVGSTPIKSCEECRGQGSNLESTTLRFQVPIGAESGTRLIMKGRGEPSSFPNGEAGDLFIEIEVETHPWFERSGSDLIMSLPLGYSDLVLGTKIDLDHVDGKSLEISVPPFSNSGDTITIRQRGLPNHRTGRNGDVVVLLKLHMPTKLSKEAKKTLTTLRDELGPEDVVKRILEDSEERRGK